MLFYCTTRFNTNRVFKYSSAVSGLQVLQFPALCQRIVHVFPMQHALARIIVVMWKGNHSGSVTIRTGAKGLSFYYPKMLCCLDRMLTMMMLDQHQVSSFKTVRPRTPWSTRYMKARY